MQATFITTFLLAIVISVSALSLPDLDQIPADTVTPGCLAAYGKEISACPDAANFQEKKACSSECEDALNTSAKGIVLACRQAFVSPDSLLRKILDGGLVTTLCPASPSPSPYASGSLYATGTTASATSTTAPTYSPSTTAANSAKIKTETETETETGTSTSAPSVISFSGFMTVTTSDGSASSVPSALTLDDSAEPTVSSEVSALGVEVSSTTSASRSAKTSPPTASGNGSPFESSASTTATSSQQNAAGSVKVVLVTVMISVSVALGAAFL